MKTQQIQYRPGLGWEPPLPSQWDGPRTLVLAFGDAAPQDPRAALQELAAAFPQALVMGCSSAGLIGGRHVHDGGLSVVVARFEQAGLRRAATVIDGAADSFAAGSRLAAQLPAEDLRAVFVLADGLAVNGTALVQGLSAHLPANVLVSGGLAGDGSRFERTWVLEAGQPSERRVTAVGLYGPALRIGHGCSGGWLEFGPERRVTRSEGNVLYEIDGQPALALYKRYLGKLAAQLPGSALLFPLSLRGAGHGATTVVRTILGIDEASQSMTFAGDVPCDATVQLMRTQIDHLVSSAEAAVAQAMAEVGAEPAAGPPVLALSVSCIGRRLVMGERTDEELEAVFDRLPAGSAHGGFYSYGEIARGSGCDRSDLHNQTMTLTVIAEQPAQEAAHGPRHSVGDR